MCVCTLRGNGCPHLCVVCVSVFSFLHALSVCVSVCIGAAVCVSVCVSLCVPVCVCVCACVCVCVCVYVRIREVCMCNT